MVRLVDQHDDCGSIWMLGRGAWSHEPLRIVSIVPQPSLLLSGGGRHNGAYLDLERSLCV